jgi:bleomycin hydrolase
MEDKEYRKVYTVERLEMWLKVIQVRYLNVTSEEMKAASVSSIKDDHPVWFGCDVGKHFDRKLGVMDMDLFDFNSFYQSSF